MFDDLILQGFLSKLEPLKLYFELLFDIHVVCSGELLPLHVLGVQLIEQFSVSQVHWPHQVLREWIQEQGFYRTLLCKLPIHLYQSSLDVFLPEHDLNRMGQLKRCLQLLWILLFGLLMFGCFASLSFALALLFAGTGLILGALRGR